MSLDLLTRDDLALTGILTSLTIFLIEKVFRPSKLIDKAIVQLSITLILALIAILRKRYKFHHIQSSLLKDAHEEIHTFSKVLKRKKAIG